MLIKKPTDILSSEITSRDNYLNRRAFMRAGGIMTILFIVVLIAMLNLVF